MVESKRPERDAKSAKNTDYFIEYSAPPFGGCKEFGTSKSGLKYALLSYGSFEIPEIKPGDLPKLAINIVKRYKDGIMLDSDGLIGNICNCAQYQDVPAVSALEEIDRRIISMGPEATVYQRRLRNNVKAALHTLKVSLPSRTYNAT